MSFYFARALRSVRKVAGEIKQKKNESDAYLKKLRNNESISESTKKNLESNPFFVMHKGKVYFTDKFEGLKKMTTAKTADIYNKTKEKYDNIPIKKFTEDSLKPNRPSESNSTISKVIKSTKNAAIAVIDTLSSIIKTITFGYVDFGSLRREIIIKRIKESKLVLFFSSPTMLATVNKAKHFLVISQNKLKKFMENYRDPKYAVGLPNLERIGKEFSEKGKVFNILRRAKERVINSKIISRLSKYTTVFSLSKIEKVREYFNSPQYKKNIYEARSRVANFFKARAMRDRIDRVKNFKFNRSMLSPSSMKMWIKKKFLKVLLAVFGIYAFIYGFKYSFEHLKHRKLNRQLAETHEIISELKQQNNEIKRTNEELLRALKNR